MSDKRQAILDSALELFVERTFYGANMPDLAARAGVAAGTVYRYFASKEELVNELFRAWKSQMALEVGGAVHQPKSIRDEFGQWWRGLGRFAYQHPTAFGFLETHQHDPYLDAESLVVSAAVSEPVLAFLRRGQRAGEIRSSSPEVLLAMVYGAFVGLARRAIDAGRPLDPRSVAAAEPMAWALVALPPTLD